LFIVLIYVSFNIYKILNVWVLLVNEYFLITNRKDEERIWIQRNCIKRTKSAETKSNLKEDYFKT